MKKLNFYLEVFVICLACLSISSCKKATDALNPNKNCDDLSNEYITAYQEWLQNQTVENCEAWVDALEDYVNGCGLLTAAQKEEFQDAIEAADCSD